MTADASDRKARKSAERRCPTCGKPAVASFRPFCSARCRDIDLGRWLTESYVVPGRPQEEGGDEEIAQPDAPTGRSAGTD